MEFLKNNWKIMVTAAALVAAFAYIIKSNAAEASECFNDCVPIVVSPSSDVDDWQTGMHTFTATYKEYAASGRLYSGDMSGPWHLRLERSFGDRFTGRIQYADDDGVDEWTAGGIFHAFSHKAFYGDVKGFYVHRDDDAHFRAEAEVGVDYENDGPWGAYGFGRAVFEGGIDRDNFDYSGLVFEGGPTYRFKRIRLGAGPRCYVDMQNGEDFCSISTRGTVAF